MPRSNYWAGAGVCFLYWVPSCVVTVVVFGDVNAALYGSQSISNAVTCGFMLGLAACFAFVMAR